MAETLPIFPLNTVLLPGTALPLHIFEPRYRQLTVDLMTGAVADRSFGVIAIRPGWSTEVNSLSQVHDVGCSALLRQAKRLPDGGFDIVTRGERRFRLLALDAYSAPYLVGSVRWLPDSEPSGAIAEAVPVLSESARAAHRRYCGVAWQREDWAEPGTDTDTMSLAHQIAADCVLALEDRQRLLEETNPLRRLRMVRRLLNRETGILNELRAVPASLFGLGSRPSRN
ncbi:MAG: LON peptidase substrate-binding domain-containing protein [Kutzneria sp.]|nr:LON peptidase substrate-binding domain-containing protein [Kutzneria sp.]MBV9844585.1 LON peptidase substrate-binding domain-containing protein [Kutzneria sp.]